MKKVDIKTMLKVAYGAILILVLLIALLVIFTDTQLTSGYGMYVVQSGSMEPAVRTGSVIFIRSTDEYDVDDIVTVQSGTESDGTYTHRIYEVNEEEGGTTYTTKGDANDVADLEPVEESQILGEVILKVPLLGYAVSFSKTQLGLIILIIIPAVLIISNEVGTIKTEVKRLIENKRSAKGGLKNKKGRSKKSLKNEG